MHQCEKEYRKIKLSNVTNPFLEKRQWWDFQKIMSVIFYLLPLQEEWTLLQEKKSTSNQLLGFWYMRIFPLLFSTLKFPFPVFHLWIIIVGLIYKSHAPSVEVHREAQCKIPYLRHCAPVTELESTIYYSGLGAWENAICTPIWAWRMASPIQF